VWYCDLHGNNASVIDLCAAESVIDLADATKKFEPTQLGLDPIDIILDIASGELQDGTPYTALLVARKKQLTETCRVDLFSCDATKKYRVKSIYVW